MCKIWDTDGKALHDSFAGAGQGANGNPLPGLAQAVGAPGAIADLMDAMADVAPSEIEGSFKELAEAFRQLATDLTNPLAAVEQGMVTGANAAGAYERANAFLASNCGIPGGS